MKQGDKGMPRKNCPARMGKVKLRNQHWRERRVIDEVDDRGNPKRWHYVSEPLIYERPLYNASYARQRARGHWPKHALDAEAPPPPVTKMAKYP